MNERIAHIMSNRADRVLVTQKAQKMDYYRSRIELARPDFPELIVFAQLVWSGVVTHHLEHLVTNMENGSGPGIKVDEIEEEPGNILEFLATPEAVMGTREEIDPIKSDPRHTTFKHIYDYLYGWKDDENLNEAYREAKSKYNQVFEETLRATIQLNVLENEGKYSHYFYNPARS